MLNHIWLSDWSDYSSKNTGDENYLSLGKLNIFIGRNNSGKSRLIRLLYGSDNSSIRCRLDDDNLDQKMGILNNIHSFVPLGASINTVNGTQLDNLLKMPSPFLLSENDRTILNNLITEVRKLKGGHSSSSNMNSQSISGLRAHLKGFYDLNNEDILDSLNITKINTNKIYIPILRGMRPISSEHDTPYLERTHIDYFSGNDNLRDGIHTGENLYSLLRKFLLGLPEQREKIKVYEELLSQKFFENQLVTIIPKYDEDVINVKIANEPQLPIQNLGDGLQQIIIITSIAYLTEKPSIILIEEPENCLHPGFLRQLISFLLDDTPHQYFVTSHSNHLLEFAEERTDTLAHKLKKIEKDKKFEFEITTVSKDRDILLDLGVKSSSLYLSNCTVWVEGITDRLYLKIYMKKYLSHLKESNVEKYQFYNKFMDNYHYGFVEYQGGNLAHWSFNDDNEVIDELKALSVSTPIFLIADGDIKGKADRVQTLEEQLADQFFILKGKEIENLIPDNIIKLTARQMFNSFRRNKYDKDINDIEKLKYNDYVNSQYGIGYHIDKCLGLSGKGSRSNGAHLIFADESGTIKDKTKFCTNAISLMDSIEWEITEEICEICEEIFNHIEKHNEI